MRRLCGEGVRSYPGRSRLLEGRSLVEEETRWVRYRKETPLTEAEDRLFHWTAE